MNILTNDYAKPYLVTKVLIETGIYVLFYMALFAPRIDLFYGRFSRIQISAKEVCSFFVRLSVCLCVCISVYSSAYQVGNAQLTSCRTASMYVCK